MFLENEEIKKLKKEIARLEKELDKSRQEKERYYNDYWLEEELHKRTKYSLDEANKELEKMLDIKRENVNLKLELLKAYEKD
jgi:predicted  nucleic acid-binding Zn-ribbon protein